MAERFKAHAWKACKRETVSRVRIPLSPPFLKVLNNLQFIIRWFGRHMGVIWASIYESISSNTFIFN